MLFLSAMAAMGAGTGASPQQADRPAGTQDEPVDFEEIVVTAGRYDTRTPKQEPIAYFREHCWEANRLRRESSPPEGDPDWLPLDDELREALRMTDPEAEAFMLVDGVRGHTLILRIERLFRRNLQENRCTVIVVGGASHASLRDQMVRLFRSQPYRGDMERFFGLERIPGWQHWLWTAMPGRGSQRWHAFRPSGGPSSAGIIVLEDFFYDQFDYLLADLKTSNNSARPVSMMSLVFIRRASRR
jgi:hypothetical protein